MNSNTPTPTSFEDSLRELEDTVNRLEAGDLPLEQSLALFEKGVGSLKRCHAVLDLADKRVRMLVKRANGTAELEDVTPGAPSQPVAAQVRKKSVKQSIDLEPQTRQNTSSTTVLESDSLGRSDGDGKLQSQSGSDDMGLGGSLFVGTK
ncbi:MAG: exodeoxyribonuclease VII small subunit [Planctomycetota bacterium]